MRLHKDGRMFFVDHSKQLFIQYESLVMANYHRHTLDTMGRSQSDQTTK